MVKHWVTQYDKYEIDMGLVKNGIWRWYTSIRFYHAQNDKPERTTYVSFGSNAITRYGVLNRAKKEVRRLIKETNGGLTTNPHN